MYLDMSLTTSLYHQLYETAGKNGRDDVINTLKRFRAYEGETEGEIPSLRTTY